MAAKNEKIQKILLFLLFFCSLYISLESNLFVFCEVILYTQRTQKHAEQKREREKFERERGTCWRFFLSSSSVAVLLLCRLDGERERVILNFRSFLFVVSPLHHHHLETRRENDSIINNNNSREREKERKRFAGLGARFLSISSAAHHFHHR